MRLWAKSLRIFNVIRAHGPQRATPCHTHWACQKRRTSSHAGDGRPTTASRGVVVGNGSRPRLAHPAGGSRSLHVWSQARRGAETISELLSRLCLEAHSGCSPAPGEGSWTYGRRQSLKPHWPCSVLYGFCNVLYWPCRSSYLPCETPPERRTEATQNGSRTFRFSPEGSRVRSPSWVVKQMRCLRTLLQCARAAPGL
jgi:hypothetical protein